MRLSAILVCELCARSLHGTQVTGTARSPCLVRGRRLWQVRPRSRLMRGRANVARSQATAVSHAQSSFRRRSRLPTQRQGQSLRHRRSSCHTSRTMARTASWTRIDARRHDARAAAPSGPTSLPQRLPHAAISTTTPTPASKPSHLLSGTAAGATFASAVRTQFSGLFPSVRLLAIPFRAKPHAQRQSRGARRANQP